MLLLFLPIWGYQILGFFRFAINPLVSQHPKTKGRVIARNNSDYFSFLINIFHNDKELISKFKRIAEKNKKSDWINYFSIYQIIYNEININYNIEEIMKKMLILLKNTNDPILQTLIRKDIKKINNA